MTVLSPPTKQALDLELPRRDYSFDVDLPLNATRKLGSPRLQQALDLELHPLTILRFFAAFWVVFAHQSMYWNWIKAEAFTPIREILGRGDIAVKVFFILSGFILTHVYAKKDRIDIKGFLVARFARIYPLYLTALLLAIPLLLLFEIPREVAAHGRSEGFLLSGLKAASVLLLSQSWIPSFGSFWNAVSWSLSTEAFFYLSFPILLPVLKRLPTRGIFAALAVCLVLESLRWMGFCVFEFQKRPSSEIAFWVFTPILRLPDFVSGILIGLLWLRGIRIRGFHAVFGAILVAVGCQFSQAEVFPKIISLHLGCCLLIHSLAFSCTSPGKLIRVGVLLGQASFATYLIHEPLGFYFSIVSMRLVGHESPYSLYIALLLACSLALYLWVESPAREYLRKKLR